MTTLELGAEPGTLLVHFAAGGDFFAALQAQNAEGTPVPWPVGTSLRLVLIADGVEQSWPFVVSGTLAQVTIPESQVNLLPQWPVPKAQLWLGYGEDQEFLWQAGDVIFHG